MPKGAPLNRSPSALPITLPIVLCLAVSGPVPVPELDGMDQATMQLRSSAEMGELRAMRDLASLLLASRVKTDQLEAADWLAEAAASGDPEAMHRLACVWFAGRGVEQDPVEAVAWLRKAAEQGHTDAQHDLAFFEFPGVAVKKDLFPWDDVEVCLREQSQSKKIDTSTKCPECGNSVTVILFTSPPWTWEQLCGREGYLTICEGCHAQLSFELTVMN